MHVHRYTRQYQKIPSQFTIDFENKGLFFNQMRKADIASEHFKVGVKLII